MTITVHCPSCSTAFPVDPDKVPAGGVNARCSACGNIFFVDKPDAFEDAPAEPTPDEVEIPAVRDVPDAPGEIGEIEGPGPEEDFAGTAESDPFDAGGFSLPEEGDAVGTEVEGAETGDPDDWVFERDPEIDPATLDVEPMETVESSQDLGEDFPDAEAPMDGIADRADPAEWDSESPRRPESETLPEAVPEAVPEAPDEAGSPEVIETPEAPEAPAVSGEAETEEAPTGFQFGRRDPHDKARRLARVLVSDMIMYNPERHTRALSAGTLKEDFEDEIKKSWEEYVEQVGQDIAGSNSYFSDALNDILAKGEDVFQGNPPT